MHLDMPKVTVVITTYKRPKMLKEALESVLAQTFRDFEVVVVDDGSDTLGEALEAVKPAYDEAGIVLQGMNLQENSGYQCVPKNFGILYAAGSYIAYLDDDNLWDPDHLQGLIDEIEKGGCDAVYSRWRYVGDGPGSGEEFPWTPMRPASAIGLVQGPQYNFIDTSSILHSKGAFVSEMGGNVWNPEVRRFGDWEMVARSLRNGLRWRGVDRASFTYRWHGENLQITRPASEKDVTFQGASHGK